MTAPAPKRWNVEILYRTAAGPAPIPHVIEELAELHDLVEAGPDWDTIIRISITKGRTPRRGYTVEQAAEE